MREKYEEELRVAQVRGVVSPEEAEALLAEGLRAGRHPLELLVKNGVISEETLAELQAAARAAALPWADARLPPRGSDPFHQARLPRGAAPAPRQRIPPARVSYPHRPALPRPCGTLA